MRWQPASRPLARVRCHKAQPPMFGDLAGNVVRGLILLLWKRRVLRLRWIKLPRSWNEPRCGECHQRDHIHHSSRLSPARCGGAREQSATGNGQMLMGERHVRSARAARQTSSERCSGERRRERWCAPQARSFFRGDSPSVRDLGRMEIPRIPSTRNIIIFSVEILFRGPYM